MFVYHILPLFPSPRLWHASYTTLPLPFYQVLQSASTTEKIFCDNKGLIICIHQTQQADTLSPCRCMLSESDIELKIRDTLQALNTDVAFHHVKGHQNETKPTVTLPLPAQLNQQCNNLATKMIA